METGVVFEPDSRGTTRGQETEDAVALPYLSESLPVSFVGAGAVAAFVLMLDTLSGNPLGTPNMLGAAFLRGDTISISAPIQPGLVFGYTLLHIAAFAIVAAAAVSAEFTLSRAKVAPKIQLLAGATGLLLALTAIMGTLMTLLGVDWVSAFGIERLISVNAVAALSMAITVYVRGEGRRLIRSALRTGS
jgi:hypothetical protein